MPSLTLPNRLIWFAHCPKAGGTSVEQFMVATFGDAVGHLHWGWDLWWRRGGWQVADPPNSPQHLVWDDALRVLESSPDLVFTVVRDPAARMASEYRWQRRGRRGTKLGKALSYLPFSLWLRLMLAVAAKNPHAFDNHFRAQVEFVPETATVFRLEDGLAPVVDWLRATAGLSDVPQDLPHSLSTGTRTQVTPGDRWRIVAAYGADYRRFGYAVPPDPPVPRLWRESLSETLVCCLAPLVVALDRRGRL